MNLTKAQITEMNAKLDILFDQIDTIEDEDTQRLIGYLLDDWRMAKVAASLGGMPMQCSCKYSRAYNGLKDLGLDVSGMLPPVEVIE